jgi:hypothetical protein
MTERKLWHYFDAHPITVVSKYPLGEVIQKPEAEGRIAKWALELMGQNITYAPHNAIKSQVLADFVVDWMEIQTPPASIEHETWIMYFDGSVMKEPVWALSSSHLLACAWSTWYNYTSLHQTTPPSTKP